MDDFLIVLVIALALIVVFGFFFTNAPLPTPGENLTLAEFEVGRIGYSSSIPTNSIPLGRFTAGLQQEETIRDIPSFEVSANLISAERKKQNIPVDAHILKSLESLNINFNIVESNLYSNLVLEWNGEKVFDSASKGVQNVKIQKEKIKEENVLEIYTSASQNFWASTVYKISDFKVKQEYGEARPFKFSISSSEFESLNKAELNFFVPDRTSLGELIIKLNEQEIYHQYPAGILVNVNIDDPYKFVPGNNVLSFSAKSGVFELYDTNLTLFSNKKTVLKQKNFGLDESRLDKLGNLVTMEVDTKYVDKIGVLTVDLNGNRIQIDINQTGIKKADFSKSYLQKGDNNLVFKTTGNFEINKIKIVQ